MVDKKKIRDAAPIPSIVGTEVIEIDDGSSVYYKTTPNQILTNVFIYRGNISIAANFPTLANVKTGWIYRISAAVTDNDVTKTNTGQSFVIDDEIYWNGSNWYVMSAAENFWDRASNTLSPHIANDNVNIGSGTLTSGQVIDNGLSASTIVSCDGSKQLQSLSVGSSLSLSTNILNTIQDIRTTATPSFASVTANIITDSLTEKTLGNGIVIPTGIFAKYQIHPTFSIDSQLVDKKYVDDSISGTGSGYRDPLTISFDGQTSFALSNTPVDATKALAFLRGQKATYSVDFTITGSALTWTGTPLKTTDNPSFEIWYDINIGGITASTDVTLGGAAPSDNFVPTQKATKTYVDNKTNLLPKFSMLCQTEIDVLGDNSTYLVKYQDSFMNPTLNIGSYFNITNHEFVSPYNCWVNFNMSLMLQMPATPHSHTYMVCSLRIKNTSGDVLQSISLANGNISKLTNTWNNLIAVNGSSSVYMPTGYKASIFVDMDGSTKDVSIDGYNPSSFYASYATSINGDYGFGTLTGTPYGGASIIGSALGLIYDDNRYVAYNAVGNADFRQKGAIRFKIIPYYSGAPASYKAFVSIGASHLSSVNEIDLFHVNSSGELLAKVYNLAGTLIVDANFGVWLPSFGVQYEFELDINIDNGVTQLFINGAQKGSIATGTGTRSSDIHLFYVGQWIFNQNMTSYFYMRDLEIFNEVQHTSNYTPGINPLSYLYGYSASQFSGEIIQVV